MTDEWVNAIRATHPETFYVHRWAEKLSKLSQLFWASIGAGTEPMEVLALGVYLIEHYDYIKTVSPRVLGLVAGFSLQAILAAWDRYKTDPLYRVELVNRLKNPDPSIPDNEARRMSVIGSLIEHTREIDYVRYTGHKADYLETRAKNYPKTTPIPPTQIEAPPIKLQPPSEPPTRPPTTTIKPDESETKPTTTTTT
ncbi:hypothetical protein T265_16135, partial [Opisthorchis viverrini]